MDEKRIEQQIKDRIEGISFSVQLPNGNKLRFGECDPVFNVKVNKEELFSSLVWFDECRFAEAYIDGDIDIEGDMEYVLNCRNVLSDVHPLFHLIRRIMPLFVGQLRTNKRAISDHYEYESDFFFSFMDSSRCYSQAIFENDDESLELAQKRKLDFILESCGLKAGDRVLDVGGGWGTFVEHAGKQGVHVTALTLAKRSEEYINYLIDKLKLPCEVKYEDFHEYQSSRLYDVIVVLGVMEHLPDYRAVLKQFERLLKPNGKIYLDASSFREKYSKPTFISRHIFPGNHQFFCLHEFLTQVAKTSFEVKSVFNDRHSYYLTCREWAKSLDASRDKIVARWGERLYRIFRLYLWGSSRAFFVHNLDAFRVVLEFPEKRNQSS